MAFGCFFAEVSILYLYQKRSSYWSKRRSISNEKKLTKQRILNDKRFARKREKEQNQIVQGDLKSTILVNSGACILFIFFGIYYAEKWFFSVSIVTGIILVGCLWIYKERRKKLNIYQTISFLQEMDSFEFEVYITNLFNRVGYRVKTTVSQGDDGADSMGKDEKGKKFIIQTKRYSDTNTVGSPEIRNFVGSMNFYGVEKGIFLTTGYFSKPAIDTAKKLEQKYELILVDKDRLNKLLRIAYKYHE